MGAFLPLPPSVKQGRLRLSRALKGTVGRLSSAVPFLRNERVWRRGGRHGAQLGPAMAQPLWRGFGCVVGLRDCTPSFPFWVSASHPCNECGPRRIFFNHSIPCPENAPDVKWGISPLPLGHVLCTHSPSERSLSMCSVPGERVLEMLGRFTTHTLPSGTPHTSMRSSQFAVKESAKGLETRRDSQYM